MDLALNYSQQLKTFDLALAGDDFAAEDTLVSAMLVSLFADRLAAVHEVAAGEDRRGWWADAFADGRHLTGSRLWLLEREKELPGVILRCKLYCEEALQWFIDDGLAKSVDVAVFRTRPGVVVAIIKIALNGSVRSFRFEYDVERQVWRLSEEVQ